MRLETYIFFSSNFSRINLIFLVFSGNSSRISNIQGTQSPLFDDNDLILNLGIKNGTDGLRNQSRMTLQQVGITGSVKQQKGFLSPEQKGSKTINHRRGASGVTKDFSIIDSGSNNDQQTYREKNKLGNLK